jgi:hypothetical protein
MPGWHGLAGAQEYTMRFVWRTSAAPGGSQLRSDRCERNDEFGRTLASFVWLLRSTLPARSSRQGAVSCGSRAWPGGIGCRWCVSSNLGSRPGSSCRSARGSALSKVRHADGRGQPAPPARNCAASPPRGASALRTAPAPSHARRRNGPRGRATDRHPTPARPHQPRHHLDLPPRHRQHRDHRLRPRPPCADGPRSGQPMQIAAA